jgi:hypothetical protein
MDLDPFPVTGGIELKHIIDENLYQNMNREELSDNIGDDMNMNKNIVTHMDLRKLIEIVFHSGNERDSIVRIAALQQFRDVCHTDAHLLATGNIYLCFYIHFHVHMYIII